MSKPFSLALCPSFSLRFSSFLCSSYSLSQLPPSLCHFLLNFHRRSGSTFSPLHFEFVSFQEEIEELIGKKGQILYNESCLDDVFPLIICFFVLREIVLRVFWSIWFLLNLWFVGSDVFTFLFFWRRRFEVWNMASRVKEEERIERTLRNLLKLPENRRCINCNSLVWEFLTYLFIRLRNQKFGD